MNLIVFDLDGTLIDSKLDIANSVNHALSDCGLKTLTVNEIASFVGSGVVSLIRSSLKQIECEDRFDAVLKRFRTYYDKHLLDHTVLYPQVIEVLKRFNLTQKVIITNKPSHFSQKILDGLKISHFFLEIVGGDMAFARKPDPESLHYLINKYKVDCQKTLMIGDSPKDIETGKKAGTKTCAVGYGFGLKENLIERKPDYFIEDINGLLDLTF